MSVYKTKHWTFYQKNQELVYQDGTTKQLPSRLSRCLHALLDAEGQTLSYDQLLQTVWGTSFREANTISSVISELRKLIDHDEADVKHIKTVSKQGYRFANFAASVAVLTQQTEQDGAENSEPAEKVSPRVDYQTPVDIPLCPSSSTNPDGTPDRLIVKKPPLFLFIGSLLVIVFLVVFNALLSQKSAVKSYSAPKVLTHELGRKHEFDVSMDKKWLAYVNETSKGKRTIRLKNLTSGAVTELAGAASQNQTSPTFSPDGKILSYMLQTEQACEIWQISLSEPGFVDESKKRVTQCGLPGSWSTINFSQDGQSIFFAKSNALYEPFKLYRHDLLSGYERNITSPPSTGRGDYSMALSPDGKKLAFIRNLLWEDSFVWLLDLESGETTSAFALNSLIYSISWEDQQNIIYTADEGKVLRFNLANKTSELVSNQAQPVNFPLIRAGQLYLARGRPTISNIWHLDLQHDSMQKLTASDYRDKFPAFSTEDTIYFASDRLDDFAIWQQRNQQASLLIKLDPAMELKNIFDLNEQELLALVSGRIVKVNKTNGNFSWLTNQELKIDSFSVSADKQKLLFSHELNETWFLEQQDMNSGKSELFGVQGFTAHYWQGQIFFSKLRESGIWQYNPETRSESLYVDSVEVFSSYKWAISDNHIIVLNQNQIDLYRRNEHKAVYEKSIPLSGTVRSISCRQQACIFDLAVPGNTEIIELAGEQTLNRG